MDQAAYILIVEDEPAILRGLTDLFIYHGFQVHSEMDGSQGWERAQEGHYSCIILDVMLPGMNGFEVCHRIRQHSPTQPILMLTAKNTEEDIINGLSLGADDYVSKPFSASELVLRVKALMRRSGVTARLTKFELGDSVFIDIQKLSGLSFGREVRFTRREIAVLQYLYEQGKPVQREALLQDVWGYQSAHLIDTRTVDIHIAKIRKKIEKDPKKPEYLMTFRGEGYQLFGCRAL